MSSSSPIRTVAPAPLPRVHLSGLDGLRALAVSVVIAFHFVPAALPGGYLGVDVFFVISGFLITGLLVREHAATGRVSLPRFWLRRARRLLPALVLVVAACGAAAFLVGGDVLVRLGSQVLGAATFSSNWLFIAQGSSYLAETTPELFRNLWSLAVEEQFYLIWPIIVLGMLLLRHRIPRALIALTLALGSALAMALLFVPPGDPTRVYFGTDTHAFGLALGAALAFVLEKRFTGEATAARPARVTPLLGAIAVGGIVVLSMTMPLDDPIVTRGGLAIVAALTAVAILGATAPGSWLGAALDLAPVRWIGERSYGLYLWHWPVLVLLAAWLPSTPAARWVVPATALVITVTVAAGSYRLVEMPIRRVGLVTALRTTQPRPLQALGAVALVWAIMLTGAGIVGGPVKGEAQLAIEAGQQTIAGSEADAAAIRPVRDAPPRKPPLPGGDQIYAIGDSVMLAAAPWLTEKLPGIAIDAAVSRSMWVGPEIVRGAVRAGAMRPVLVIGLGTNGPVDVADLKAILRAVGPDTLIIVVNAQAPQPWIPGVNATLAEFARAQRQVELANWYGTIAPHIDELADDQVHPGGPISGGYYVSSIVDALQRLAELPPPRDPDSVLPQPV